MKAIARIRNGFEGKFGVPRQSGLAEEVQSAVVFEPEFRIPEALRGLEGFSHLWLIWQFDRTEREDWRPTVRPPRLGGNERIGVFATRSPFRPNAIGLSCVRLLEIRKTDEGNVLIVSGADLVNGTPIYDIKPYLPYTDCRPEASGGYTEHLRWRQVDVVIPEEIRQTLTPREEAELRSILKEDPRPAYQEQPERIYAFEFDGKRICFRVQDEVLTVTAVEREKSCGRK